jgi:HTH-type transcriptional regulator/antitoxin HigA
MVAVHKIHKNVYRCIIREILLIRKIRDSKMGNMAWKIIRTEEAYQAALNRLEEIFDCKKGDDHFDEAELLVMLIHKYEQENEPAYINPDPIEVIKYKMQENSLRNKDLVEIIGSKSKVSEVLNKKRRLTLEMIRKLSKNLHIPTELLINEYELTEH